MTNDEKTPIHLPIFYTRGQFFDENGNKVLNLAIEDYDKRKPAANYIVKAVNNYGTLVDLAQAVLTLEKGEYSKEIVFEMARVILNKLK